MKEILKLIGRSQLLFSNDIAQNTPFNYGKNRSSIRLVLQKGGN
jgi:hypothetical protein